MDMNELKILIVDDFNSMRNIIRSILKELHYSNIDEAENGEAALKMLNKKEYDLVLTDWNMPYMNGLELLQAIRKDEKLMHIPVLMLTSEVKKENVIHAAKEGASGYIVKPFNAATLHQKIKSSKQFQLQL